MNKFRLSVSVLLILFMNFYFVYGFGKNNVRVKNFKYNICSTKHFDIYYYDECKNILSFVIDSLENAYDDITKKMGVEIKQKIPFFLYIGHNDFEQNNVVYVGEATGGVTEAFKSRFTIPYLGSKSYFNSVVRHEFTHVCQFAILFAGWWKTPSLMKSIIYPHWLLEGLAVYSESNFDTTEQDVLLRDTVIKSSDTGTQSKNDLISITHLHNFNHLKPHQVELAYNESGALIAYLVDEYGWDKVMEILRLYKNRFDATSVLKDTIGIDPFTLDRKFQESIKEHYTLSISSNETLDEPEKYGKKITKSEIYNVFNSNPRFLPDDTKIVYITDKRGFYELIMQEINSGNTISLVNENNFDEIETINSGGGLSVTSDGRYIVFVGEKSKKDYLYIYDLSINKLKRIKTPLEIIFSATVSPDGKKIFFSGMDDCIVYIYSIDIDGKNPVKLIEASNFISGIAVSSDNKFLVYSQETESDTEPMVFKRDLMYYDIDKSSATKLLDIPGGKFQPSLSPDNKTVIFVLGADLFTVDIGTNSVKRLTKSICGCFNPTFSNDGKKIAFASFRNGEKHIYIGEQDNFINEYDIKKSTEPENYETKETTGTEHSNPVNNKPENKKSVTESEKNKFISETRPYRLNFSTDLFFPFLYWSSLEGTDIMMYWQLSDLTGNHTVYLGAEYIQNRLIKYETLDYVFAYIYKGLRPDLFIAASKRNKYEGTGFYVPERINLIGCIYPLSRYNRIELALESKEEMGFIGITDFLNVRSLAVDINKKEDFVLANFIRDTTTGKYLETTSGSRLGIFSQFAINSFGTDVIYQNIIFHIHNFIPLKNEQTIASRIIFGKSIGKDRGIFDAIGYDRVRMSGTNIQNRYGTDIILTNFEWRFPISKDLNYYMWYFFPDFFFKSFYGILFLDTGLVWIDESKKNFLLTEYSNDYIYDGLKGTSNKPELNNLLYCFGISFRFNTFVLQSYTLSMNFSWAYSPVNRQIGYHFFIGYLF